MNVAKKHNTKTKYKHLSLEERVEIYSLKEQKYSYRKIAERIDRDVGTISRELRRNRIYQYKQYKPTKAHEMYWKRAISQRTKAPLKNPTVYLYVRTKLRNDWSPEQIAGRIVRDLPGENISPETIYQYIYGKGKEYKLWRYLPKSHKKRRSKTGRKVRSKKQSRIPNAVSIDKRANKVKTRRQAGHFETDLMEGTRKSKTVVSVEVERKTRYTLLTKLRNKKAEIKSKKVTKKLKMIKSLSKTRKPVVKTITSDNGSENTRHEEISKELEIKYYFCHPYHSWEKGTVENTIGRVRRYIPKGSNLLYITEEHLQWLENKLNNTPRKCLDYLTPNEAMERETNKYKFRQYKKQKEASVALHPRM